MKAITYDRYGPPEVLRVRDFPQPAPGDHDVLVRIRATTVTSGDHRARTLDVPAGFGLASRLIFGVSRPRQPILGSEVAGDVAAVGKEVRGFQVGDPVIAFADAKMGCHAEYRCFPEDGLLVGKPAGLTYAKAAALPFGGLTALHFLKKAGVRRGEKILVNGASGAVGTACVQLARHLGAEVTGVCSAENADLVRSLGAAEAIDYAREDFTRAGRRWDVIVDTAGTAPFARSEPALDRGGRLVRVLATLGDMLGAPWLSATTGKKVIAGVALGTRDDLRFLAELAGEGQYEPVVDRSYPFDQIVEAHRYVDTGRKKGSVIVTVT